MDYTDEKKILINVLKNNTGKKISVDKLINIYAENNITITERTLRLIREQINDEWELWLTLIGSNSGYYIINTQKELNESVRQKTKIGLTYLRQAHHEKKAFEYINKKIKQLKFTYNT